MTKKGYPIPLGACVSKNGVNFAFFSRHATGVRLELFNQTEDELSSKFFDLDPAVNRTGDIWHIWIPDIYPGQLYGYRVDGPYSPHEGHRYDFSKLLLDPMAKAIASLFFWDFEPAKIYRHDNAGDMPKCVLTDDHFDWQNDVILRYSWEKTIIYETHVRGLSIDPSANVLHPGTFQGVIEKIPYFKKLGITAIELMPIHEFNDAGKYWGYNSVSFFSPKASYSSAGGHGQQIFEFKKMILELHKAGIEVILDIVFNHTAESDELGPTISFRGIDNSIFYMLKNDKRYYKNFSGTGNTFNANHPIVREHILSSLRYWVQTMHVDGFRFDLAAILNRDFDGNLLPNLPLLWSISEDPILNKVKLIAEPWDIEGVLEIGTFPKLNWSEWNGAYRDDIRSFWRGDEGKIAKFAERICGSADIYATHGKSPTNSINFITCHDGFTLNDLVSYNQKHNENNQQNNEDGSNENLSENYGAEGYTQDPIIEAIRCRQIKNFILTLFISKGVPMLLGGDEFRRTQHGNNNAYCQDNKTSWYDWKLLEKNQEIFAFTKQMIDFRQKHLIFRQDEFYTSHEIIWYNQSGKTPDWENSSEKKLACLVTESENKELYLIFNADIKSFDFILPNLPVGRKWSVLIDTGNKVNPKCDELNFYHVESRSSVILTSA